MSEIVAKDLMDVLREDNQRLTKELSIERQLSECLEKVREKSMVLINNCNCSQNIDIFHDLIKFEKMYHSLKDMKNVNAIQSNDKSVNEISTKTSDETNEMIINAKTPPMRQLCSTGSAQPILPADQMCDQMFTISDTIEPNLVIDLNPIESVKQKTHSIVSDNRIDETQVMAIESTQEIIDILDSDDTEDISDTMDSQSVAAVYNQTADSSSHNLLMRYTLTSPQDTPPSRWVSSAVHYPLSTDSRAPVGTVLSNGIRVCPLYSCGQCFPDMYQLRAHVNGQHPEVPNLPLLLPKRFPCPAVGCGKLFATKQYLKVHIRTAHTGLTVKWLVVPKRYPCPVRECRSRGYSSPHNLKQHIKNCHTPSSAVQPMV